MKTATKKTATTATPKSRVSKSAVDAAVFQSQASGNGNAGNAGNVSGVVNSVMLKSQAEIELLGQKWEAARKQAKELYGLADQLELEIIKSVGVGGRIVFSDRRTLFVNDNFLDKAGNVKLKSAGIAMVKRHEVEIK